MLISLCVTCMGTGEDSRGGSGSWQRELAVRVLEQSTELGWERSSDLCRGWSMKQDRSMTGKDA